VTRFDAWVRAYNADRPRRSPGGQPPLARWTADLTPLRLIAPERAGRSARVRRDGVLGAVSASSTSCAAASTTRVARRDGPLRSVRVVGAVAVG
jgi:hypothetical protein